MKKLRTFLTTASTLIIAVFAMQNAYAMERYSKGTHYTDVVPTQKTTVDDGKIEVIEFFSYQCPHCATLDPYIEDWKKTLPKDVVFKRVPAIFNRNWEVPAKAYYTAESLGILDKVHSVIFNAIHKDNKNLTNIDNMAKAMAKASGMDVEKIKSTINSFSVDNQSRNAMKMARMYSLRFVPAIAVNGQFMTSPSSAGGNDKVLDVVDFLIAKERAKK